MRTYRNPDSAEGRQAHDGPMVLCLLALLTHLAISFKSAQADEPPDLTAPEVRDVLWQVLPERFRSVFAGPDLRLWWQLNEPEYAQPEQLRALIESQFAAQSPVVYGCRPALFEPNGRVWFLTTNGGQLLAFDGKRWIERQADERERGTHNRIHRFVGACPNHGRPDLTGSNCIFQERAFFLGSHGIYVFDLAAEAWSELQVADGIICRPLLLPEPDGKGLVAFFSEAASPSSGGFVALWRWRNDAWHQIAVPDGVAGGRINGVSAAEDGIWIDERESRFRKRTEGEAPSRLGLRFIPFGDVPEQSQPRAAPAFTWGQYLAKDVSLDFWDGPGAAFIRAGEITWKGNSLGPGMLVRHKDGNVTPLLGKEFARARDRIMFDRNPSNPILLEGMDAVWLPAERDGQPARLFSLIDGSVLATMADERFGWLHAVLPDGTVFATNHTPGYHESVLIVCKPEAEDDRALLECRSVRIRYAFCIASDGAIWAKIPDKAAGGGEEESSTGTVHRFDGTTWQPVAALRGITTIQSLHAGRNGEILAAASPSRHFLLVGDQLCSAGDLETFIASHKAQFARAFFMGGHPSRQSPPLVADKAGNIWRTERRRETDSLRVLAGDHWIDAAALLPKPDGKEQDRRPLRIDYIAPVGDGSMIYITETSLSGEAASSYYAEVLDDKVAFTPAPRLYAANSQLLDLCARDQDNALWLGSMNAVANPNGGFELHGQLAYRLLGDFTHETVVDSGWPMLCDQSGCVWLGQVWQKKMSLFNIWSHGRIEGSASIPAASHNQGQEGRLISDRPGSVWAWTVTGMYHFTADDPANPAAYTLRKHYFAPDVKGQVLRITFSSLGYMVIETFIDREDGKSECFLNLLKLPKKEDEAGAEKKAPAAAIVKAPPLGACAIANKTDLGVWDDTFVRDDMDSIILRQGKDVFVLPLTNTQGIGKLATVPEMSASEIVDGVRCGGRLWLFCQSRNRMPFAIDVLSNAKAKFSVPGVRISEGSAPVIQSCQIAMHADGAILMISGGERATWPRDGNRPIYFWMSLKSGVLRQLPAGWDLNHFSADQRIAVFEKPPEKAYARRPLAAVDMKTGELMDVAPSQYTGFWLPFHWSGKEVVKPLLAPRRAETGALDRFNGISMNGIVYPLSIILEEPYQPTAEVKDNWVAFHLRGYGSPRKEPRTLWFCPLGKGEEPQLLRDNVLDYAILARGRCAFSMSGYGSKGDSAEAFVYDVQGKAAWNVLDGIERLPKLLRAVAKRESVADKMMVRFVRGFGQTGSPGPVLCLFRHFQQDNAAHFSGSSFSQWSAPHEKPWKEHRWQRAVLLTAEGGRYLADSYPDAEADLIWLHNSGKLILGKYEWSGETRPRTRRIQLWQMDVEPK